MPTSTPLPNFPAISGYSKTTPPALHCKAFENDQGTLAPVEDQVSALNDAVQEQLRNGGTNLDSDLLKLLLICHLTTTESQSFQVNQSTSNGNSLAKIFNLLF
ncbi:hypothetical protein Pst134EB_014305 [Puccinia striiformis f. sp. tritici]|nr:hypothetical protein Pst134EB_014305 [Puccinia striiformis f. sp. tritici]